MDHGVDPQGKQRGERVGGSGVHARPDTERRERFAAKPREIVEILHEGSRKAREFAKKTMDEVRSVINLEPK